MTTLPPVVAHQPAHRTRQVGRVRPRLAKADGALRDNSPETGPRNTANRASARSLTIALLLAAATVAGAGVAAWAMGATPFPAVGVLEDSGSTNNHPVTDEQGSSGSAATAASIQPNSGAGRPVTSDSTPAATLTAPLPGPAGSAPASSRLADGPAVVSTLADGDPGFGWPASAFGAAP